MSDYLENLLARELGRLDSVEPRRPSRFEPPAAAETFPTAAGRFGEARGEDSPETVEASRTWMAETSAGETETFAPAPDSPRPTFSTSPPRHSDAAPPTDEPRTSRVTAPEARPHTRRAAPFEPRQEDALSPSGQTRPRHPGRDDEASEPGSQPPKPEPTPEDARASAMKGEPTPTEWRQARTSPNVSPLTDDDASSPAERAVPSKTPPPRPSPTGLEADEAGGAPPRRAEPPRETLLVPVLDAREFNSRAAPAPNPAPAREADARASRLAEEAAALRPSKQSAHAEEFTAARAAAEHEQATARSERREVYEAEALRERRARQREAARQVQPRVTRRAESQQAERRQTDAQGEAASAPTVNVTIGRIEIRASAPAPRQAPRRESSGASPMSLEDYLRRRGGGGGGR